MPNDVEAELKHVRGKSKGDASHEARDPSMTGGERAETSRERKQRKARARKPKEAPIIERPPA